MVKTNWGCKKRVCELINDRSTHENENRIRKIKNYLDFCGGRDRWTSTHRHFDDWTESGVRNSQNWWGAKRGPDEGFAEFEFVKFSEHSTVRYNWTLNGFQHAHYLGVDFTEFGFWQFRKQENRNLAHSAVPWLRWPPIFALKRGHRPPSGK